MHDAVISELAPSKFGGYSAVVDALVSELDLLDVQLIARGVWQRMAVTEPLVAQLLSSFSYNYQSQLIVNSNLKFTR